VSTVVQRSFQALNTHTNDNLNRDIIFCYPKTQLLTTLPMWQGGPLTNFRVFFFKNKNKNCHVDKSG